MVGLVLSSGGLGNWTAACSIIIPVELIAWLNRPAGVLSAQHGVGPTQSSSWGRSTGGAQGEGESGLRMH